MYVLSLGIEYGYLCDSSHCDRTVAPVGLCESVYERTYRNGPNYYGDSCSNYEYPVCVFDEKKSFFVETYLIAILLVEIIILR